MAKTKRGRIAKYPCYAIKFLEGIHAGGFFRYYTYHANLSNDAFVVGIASAKDGFDKAWRMVFKEHALALQAELLVVHNMRTEIVHRHSSKRGKFTLPKYPVKE